MDDAELERRARARIGESLRDKWTIDRLLGIGGMAVVYAATHRNGNRVAIKMLHPHLSSDAGMRARFLREGYVGNAVDHPGAVRVLDDDVADDGSAFLVMEFLAGETLDARLNRQEAHQLPSLEVLQLVDPLLDALAAAHAKGVFHRDLKPENIFLTSDGVVKILDFGIARMRDAAGGSSSATRTGTMIGTPAFMPPEQALGKVSLIDGQTDIWAVGATMFNLLTGKFVHDAETANEHMVLAATRPAPPVRTVEPSVAREVAAVVDRALAFEKADRWPDAKAMQEAGRAAYHALQGRMSNPNAAPPVGRTEPPPRAATPAATLTTGRGLAGPVTEGAAGSAKGGLSRPVQVGIGVAVLVAAGIIGFLMIPSTASKDVAAPGSASVPAISEKAAAAPPPGATTAPAPAGIRPASIDDLPSAEPVPAAVASGGGGSRKPSSPAATQAPAAPPPGAKDVKPPAKPAGDMFDKRY